MLGMVTPRTSYGHPKNPIVFLGAKIKGQGHWGQLHHHNKLLNISPQCRGLVQCLCLLVLGTQLIEIVTLTQVLQEPFIYFFMVTSRLFLTTDPLKHHIITLPSFPKVAHIILPAWREALRHGGNDVDGECLRAGGPNKDHWSDSLGVRVCVRGPVC